MKLDFENVTVKLFNFMKVLFYNIERSCFTKVFNNSELLDLFGFAVFDIFGNRY